MFASVCEGFQKQELVTLLHTWEFAL